jgi:hypothetical protein
MSTPASWLTSSCRRAPFDLADGSGRSRGPGEAAAGREMSRPTVVSRALRLRALRLCRSYASTAHVSAGADAITGQSERRSTHGRHKFPTLVFGVLRVRAARWEAMETARGRLILSDMPS